MINKNAWHIQALSFGALCLVTIISYWASLRYGFFFDDEPTITQNIIVRTANLKSVFFLKNTRWISFLLNKITYTNWGLNPTAYRAIGLAIHILCALLIFYFLLLILKRYKHHHLFALTTTGLFLLHPLQTQTIAYITQTRLEGLVVFFTFIILILFIKAVRAKKMVLKCILYALSFAATFFAAGTKEIIITLPFVIILVDWFFGAQGNWRHILKKSPLYIFYFLIIVGMFAREGRSTLIKEVTRLDSSSIESSRGYTITAAENEKIKPLVYCISQFKVILHYISLFFWPKRLCFEYPYILSYSFFNYDVFLPFLALLAICFVTIFLLIKNKTNLISFSLIWFFLTLLPRASFIPSAEFVADYKTYLPSFGMFLLLAMGLVYFFTWLSTIFNSFYKSKNKEIARYILLAFFFIFLGFLTYQRNLVWSSKIEFWTDVISKNPSKPRALNNYATALSAAGRKEEAIEVFKKICKDNPTYSAPLINLAFHYQNRGETDKAMECYKQALPLKDHYPQMYNNIGVIHFNRGDYEKAEQCFKISIKLELYPGQAHGCLAQTYCKQNKFEQAWPHFETAFKSDHRPIELYYLHATTGLKLGHYDKTIDSLHYIRSHNHNYKDVLFLLGSCYYLKGDNVNATLYFKEAYDKDKSINTAYNLAQSYLNMNEYKKAIPFFEQCMSNDESFPFAKVHRARCYAEIGQKQQARKLLEEIEKSTNNINVKNEAQNLLK